MKTILSLLVVVLLAILPVRGAVVINDLTDLQYSNIVSTTPVSWSVEMIAGFPSDSTTEITLSANNVQAVSHIWHYPEQITVGYDGAGNLNVRVGSTVLTAQPTIAFNTILIMIGDRAQFFPTELKDSKINDTAIRNLFANDNDSSLFDYDQVQITNLDSTFSIDSSFYLNSVAVLSDSKITITGINASSVPEPSSLVINFLFLASVIFIRKR